MYPDVEKGSLVRKYEDIQFRGHKIKLWFSRNRFSYMSSDNDEVNNEFKYTFTGDLDRAKGFGFRYRLDGIIFTALTNPDCDKSWVWRGLVGTYKYASLNRLVSENTLGRKALLWYIMYYSPKSGSFLSQELYRKNRRVLMEVREGKSVKTFVDVDENEFLRTSSKETLKFYLRNF